MKWGPVILDLEKEVLTPEEAELVQHPACSGVILFQRNYSSPSQLAALTSHIRQVKPKAIIAVLDIDHGKSAIIHDRNLGEDAASVTALAQVIIEVMHQFRMPVTGKHF